MKQCPNYISKETLIQNLRPVVGAILQVLFSGCYKTIPWDNKGQHILK